MPPISIKKVLIAILIIVLVAKLDKVLALVSWIFQALFDSSEPLHIGPGRFVGILILLALAYITILKLLKK